MVLELQILDSLNVGLSFYLFRRESCVNLLHCPHGKPGNRTSWSELNHLFITFTTVTLCLSLTLSLSSALSLQSFMFFFFPALYFISVSLFPFSLLLWTAFPMRCRRGYTQIQEGITEKTSLVTTVSVAMLLTNFYNWSVWSHEWKMTILLLWPKKQVGERYSLAIRNLTQVLNASAGLHSVFLLLVSVWVCKSSQERVS